jgi:hypothetical protein
MQYQDDVAPLVPEPPLRAPRHDFLNDQFTSTKPSISRRMFRALARFFIAVLIGVGATLAWQSYGDEAKQLVSNQAPWLGWILSASTTKSPSDGQVPAQDARLPQSTPVAQIPAPALPVTSPEIRQQLQPIARDLAAVQRGVEQLAARQDQMAQSIAWLADKLAPPPASQAVPIPPRKPRQHATQSPAAQPLSEPPPPATQQPVPLH